MNVLLVCHVFPPEHSQAGHMVRELAEDLSASGHRVTVLTGWPSHPKGTLYPGWSAGFRGVERAEGGYRVIRCGHSLHGRYNAFWRAWYYLTFGVSTFINGLATGRVDAICNISTPFFGVALCWLLARVKRARDVYVPMDLLPEAVRNAGLIREESKMYQMLLRLDSLVCRNSRAVATLSEKLREGIIGHGASPDKVKIIPLWLDPGRIRPGNRDNPWRRAQGIGMDKFVAMYAGTIGYASGAEVLVETAALLADREDILLLFVGEGPVKQIIQDQMAARGLRNVRFLPFQPNEVLSDMQSSADVGLVTLRPGGGETSVPSKVIGYISAGRPVVAGVPLDSPTATLLRRGQCGRIVASEDAAGLAEAIASLADDRESTRRMGASAREYFLAHHSREIITRQYEEILKGDA